MTFLNGILALGALAFTLPLAIHLLFRSRFRTVEWGAMHLLDSVVRINRRRIQLMHLLLLLLRCLLPVLLAFCLARPVLTGFQTLPGDAPRSVVIAIDDSRSMAARLESGLTRMDLAKQGIGQLLENLSRRDEVILLPSSQVDAPTSAQGAQEAVRRVRELSPQFGPTDLGTLMRAAIEAADQASHPQRQVLLVGDFASRNVDDAAMTSLSSIAKTLEDKPIQPVISFWNLGIDSNQLSNVSVDSVEVDSPAVVARRGSGFLARLRNASDLPVRDLRVTWALDGRELRQSTITIPPRSTATSRLTHSIEEVGVHALTVSVEHADALIEDNRRSIGVDAIREIKVLLVDGQPGSEPLEGETDYLAVALSPFAFGGDDQPDAVRTTVIRSRQIESELQSEAPDLLVLANVEEVAGTAREAVARFVLRGGSLLIFDGDQVRPESFNEPWSCDEGSWTLPAKLNEVVGSSSGDDRAALPIGEKNPIYSPWGILAEGDENPFSDVEIYAYRKLSLANDAASDADDPDDANTPAASPSQQALPMTLWRMASGDPLAIAASRGQTANGVKGRIVQVAIPCDTAWSTLPLRLVYLPMMQQLVLELAGSRKQTTVTIGDGFAVPVSELETQLSADANVDPDQEPEYRLETPGQGDVPIRPVDESLPQLVIGKTDRTGVYRLRKLTPQKDAAAVETSTIRLVEVPASESELRDTDPSRLAAAAKLVDAKVYSDLESLQGDDRTRRYGREVWRWLLVAILVVLVSELWIQQRSVRSSGIPSSELGAS